MHGTLLLLVQILVVLIPVRLVGRVFVMIGQPRIVGEMAAGLLLGPTFLAAVFPAELATLFPPEGVPALMAIRDLALILFMLLVGLEFEPRVLRGLGKTALVVSVASIAVPLGSGILGAWFLHDRLAADVPTLPFVLFMGAAMSVTAFPILARILIEQGMTRTRVGVLSIASAAFADVGAWILLAGLMAYVGAKNAHPLYYTMGGLLLFIAAMIFVVRPVVAKILHRQGALDKEVLQPALALVLTVMVISAAVAEYLGLHALFGAFLAGAIFPRDETFREQVTEKIKDLTVVLFLPVFFIINGMNAKLNFATGGLWLDCGLILLIAIVGKFGGATLAARAMGVSWRESAAIGSLMNTRGLIELVFLNIGLDLKILPPQVFAMMVLMTLVTTATTSPMLALFYPPHLREKVPSRKSESPAPDAPARALPT